MASATQKQYYIERDLYSARQGPSQEVLFANQEAIANQEMEMLGIGQADIDQQCKDLFTETPIKFIPRKFNEIDEMIDLMIETMEIPFPIIWIKGKLYLIGSNRLTVDLKN